MKVVELALADVKPYWRNPRINEPAIEAVKASIARYGFNSPLIVDKDHVIIAGHTRYKALMQLGWERVPVVVVDLPKQLAKEYRIADNKTSEFAQWNLEALLPELREIKEIEAMQTYFPEYDLADLLKESGGSAYSPPTQDDVDRLTSNMESQFADQSTREQASYVDVLCPHCRRGFKMARGDIERAPEAEIDHDPARQAAEAG